MDIDAALRDRIADICRRYRVQRLSLFGSEAVGAERPDSDVDLLVEYRWRRQAISSQLQPIYQ